MARYPLLLSLIFALYLPQIQDAAWANDGGVATLIAKLADPDGDVRAEAAAELRRLLAGDFAATTNNHGRLYWEERLRQVKPGMKQDEVLQILPRIDDDIAEEGSGQSHSSHWRLDDYWTVSVYYNNPDIVHEARPILNCRARAVWVDPPANFTGTWATWHVNGQKANEIEFANGMRSGAYVTFHDNGRKVVEQHNSEDINSGSERGWYADGSKMYEGQYVDGERDGTWTHWYEDGRLQSREELRLGKYHGRRESRHESGQKRYESTYQKDNLHGTDKAWDWDGKLLWSRVYRNGEQAN